MPSICHPDGAGEPTARTLTRHLATLRLARADLGVGFSAMLFRASTGSATRSDVHDVGLVVRRSREALGAAVLEPRGWSRGHTTGVARIAARDGRASSVCAGRDDRPGPLASPCCWRNQGLACGGQLPSCARTRPPTAGSTGAAGGESGAARRPPVVLIAAADRERRFAARERVSARMAGPGSGRAR